MFHAEIYCYSTNQIVYGNCHWPSGRVVRHSTATREDPSSKPAGTKIYFESKPISSFKNLLEKAEHDEEENDDDES